MHNTWSIFDELGSNSNWWSPITFYAYGYNLAGRRMYKILCKFRNREMLRKLLQSLFTGILINQNISWWNYTYSMTQKFLVTRCLTCCLQCQLTFVPLCTIKNRVKATENWFHGNCEGNQRDSWIETRVTDPQNWWKGVTELGSQCFVSLDWSSNHRPNLLGSHKTEILREATVKGNEIKEGKGTLCHTHWTYLFFGPCIFNNEDKNKPTKCTN